MTFNLSNIVNIFKDLYCECLDDIQTLNSSSNCTECEKSPNRYCGNTNADSVYVYDAFSNGKFY